jgi:hypothetical protein
MNNEKREFRQLKREIKKAGNRKMRRQLNRQLAQDPESAAEVEFDYGRNSSAPLNGNDRDSTRRRKSQTQDDETDEFDGIAQDALSENAPSDPPTDRSQDQM